MAGSHTIALVRVQLLQAQHWAPPNIRGHPWLTRMKNECDEVFSSLIHAIITGEKANIGAIFPL